MSLDPQHAAPLLAASPPPRITESEALQLYHECSIHELGRRAHAVTQRLHPEPYRTYVVDRNINYANWCTARCIFCNFKAAPRARREMPAATSCRGPDVAEAAPRQAPSVSEGSPDGARSVSEGSPDGARSASEGTDGKTIPGYVLTFDQIAAKIRELLAIGGTQVLMQGGLVPPEILPFSWYLDLLRFIKREFPGLHVHAFSPPEVFWFHQVFGMGIRDVLLRLRDAGLDTIPGGGAEILVDAVRDKISRGKTRTDEYLEVMRQAHRIGMRTSMTMMFGHLETPAERIEHLRRVRDLQDETGGFTAFICWAFQPENTPLGRWPQRSVNGAAEERADETCPEDRGNSSPPDHADSDIRDRGDLLPHGRRYLNLAGAHEYLRTLAIARLFLDNVPNLQASWVTQGPKIGQLALFFGANDMGSVMMEENVVSAAGTTYRLTEPDLRRLIADAGWQPRKRNCYYQLLE